MSVTGLFDPSATPAPTGHLATWEAGGHRYEIGALGCKAIYTAGLIRHLVESAGYCLAAPDPFHLAAYQLGVSAFEPLGLVLEGRKRDSDKLLRRGLLFAAGDPPGRDPEIVSTAHGAYAVGRCIELRHFTAHGGRDARAGTVLDAELTAKILELALRGLDRWWARLLDGEGRRSLANAPLVPLTSGGELVFVSNLVAGLVAGGMPGGAVDHQRVWHRTHPQP